LDPIQRGNEMHFRGAGVGEADVHAACDQCPHQTFRTVHRSAPVATFLGFLARSTIVQPFRQRVSRALLLSRMTCRPFLTGGLENAAVTGSLVAQAFSLWPVSATTFRGEK